MKPLLLVCLALLLSGCPSSNVVYVPTTQYVVMDDDWLKDCVVVPPPEKTSYDASLEAVKRAMWSKAYIKQMAEVDTCNLNKSKARDFNKLAKDKNAAALLLLQRK